MRRLTEKIIQRIAAEPRLFLFLDYDGTLTPIASEPSKAKLSPAVRQFLRELKAAQNIRVAVVSGRSLANLKQYVRIPGLIYAGNHGFEIQGQGISYVHPAARALKNTFRKLTRQLQRALAPFPGVVVEHKTYSISVHYRKVRSLSQIRSARRVLLEKLKLLKHTAVVLARGKKVWEIRPTAAWHKGATVAWLMRRAERLERKRFFPVYIGDDATDEDAFRAIRKKGVGIKVISGNAGGSRARYVVRSPGEAIRFLRKIVSLRKDAVLQNVE